MNNYINKLYKFSKNKLIIVSFFLMGFFTLIYNLDNLRTYTYHLFRPLQITQSIYYFNCSKILQREQVSLYIKNWRDTSYRDIQINAALPKGWKILTNSFSKPVNDEPGTVTSNSGSVTYNFSLVPTIFKLEDGSEYMSIQLKNIAPKQQYIISLEVFKPNSCSDTKIEFKLKYKIH